MKNKKTDTLLQESFLFIGQNMNILSDEIPQHFRAFWNQDDKDEKGDPDGIANMVFMYALINYYKNKGVPSFDISADKIEELYQGFKTVLSLAEISALTSMRIKPIRIFDFDNYEKVHVEISYVD